MKSTNFKAAGTLAIDNWIGWRAEYQWEGIEVTFNLIRKTLVRTSDHMMIRTGMFSVNNKDGFNSVTKVETAVNKAASKWLMENIIHQ